MTRCDRGPCGSERVCRGLAAWLASWLALAFWGCAASVAPTAATPEPAAEDAIVLGPAPFFEFLALDGAKISSDESRGRSTILLFLTTFGGASQAQARFLTDVAHAHVPRTNCYAIFTELKENRPLVEMFVEMLHMGIPVAHVAYSDLKDGPFSDVVAAPTLVVLDGGGHRVWRKTGVVKREEIEAVLVRIEGR